MIVLATIGAISSSKTAITGGGGGSSFEDNGYTPIVFDGTNGGGTDNGGGSYTSAGDYRMEAYGSAMASSGSGYEEVILSNLDTYNVVGWYNSGAVFAPYNVMESEVYMEGGLARTQQGGFTDSPEAGEYLGMRRDKATGQITAHIVTDFGATWSANIDTGGVLDTPIPAGWFITVQMINNSTLTVYKKGF